MLGLSVLICTHKSETSTCVFPGTCICIVRNRPTCVQSPKQMWLFEHLTFSPTSPMHSSAWWACSWHRAMWQELWPCFVTRWRQPFPPPLSSHPLLRVSSAAPVCLFCVACSFIPSFTTFQTTKPAHVSNFDAKKNVVDANKKSNFRLPVGVCRKLKC